MSSLILDKVSDDCALGHKLGSFEKINNFDRLELPGVSLAYLLRRILVDFLVLSAILQTTSESFAEAVFPPHDALAHFRIRKAGQLLSVVFLCLLSRCHSHLFHVLLVSFFSFLNVELLLALSFKLLFFFFILFKPVDLLHEALVLDE